MHGYMIRFRCFCILSRHLRGRVSTAPFGGSGVSTHPTEKQINPQITAQCPLGARISAQRPGPAKIIYNHCRRAALVGSMPQVILGTAKIADLDSDSFKQRYCPINCAGFGAGKIVSISEQTARLFREIKLLQSQ